MSHRTSSAVAVWVETLESRRLLSAAVGTALPVDAIPTEPLMPIDVNQTDDTSGEPSGDLSGDGSGDTGSGEATPTNGSGDVSTDPAADGSTDAASTGIMYTMGTGVSGPIRYASSPGAANHPQSSGAKHHAVPAGTFQSARAIGAFTLMSARMSGGPAVATAAKAGGGAAVQPSGGGIAFSATAKQAFTKVIGTFNQPSVDQVFTAKIKWGDGRSSNGVVAGSPATGDFTVTGTHKYNHTGQYTVKVAIVSSIVGGHLKSTLTHLVSVATVK